jgi:hypothetical protein
VEALKQLMAAGHSWAGAAAILTEQWGEGVTWSGVRSCARVHGFNSNADQSSGPPWVRRYRDFWRLQGDWVIAGDLHLPLADWELCGKVAVTAKARGIKNLLIGGDVFDMQAYGHYEALVTPPPPEADRIAGLYVMGLWRDWFTDIRILMGNHDARLLKALSGRESEETLAAVFLSRLGGPDNVQVSIYGYCIVDTPTGEWRVTHPGSFGRNQLSVANNLARKFGSHILTFHEHHDARGWDDSGQYVVANIGMLADPAKLAYSQLVDRSSTPVMRQSFGVLQNGALSIVSRSEAVA